MSTESNSIACSLLIEIKGCTELTRMKQGIQYAVDFNSDPRILFKDANGNKREMKFKQNCTVTITGEKIFYNRDAVTIKPA
jgi:hypothetical protein